MELSTSATGDDLVVVITGRLQELGHNPASVQVVATNSEKGQSLSLQDVNGVFLCVPTSIDMLKITTLLNDRGASVPSLMTGSSCTSPVLSDSETSDVALDTLPYQEEEIFSVEEENLEKVLKLMQQELQESQSEAVSLQAAIVYQQQKLRNYFS